MSPAKRTEKIRVLVVDDEPAVLDFVDRVLREAGYDTALASNDRDAMKIADNLDAFNLIVTASDGH